MNVDATVEWRSRISVNLAALIRDNLDEYRATDLRGGYAEWERPSVFLHAWLEDGACDPDLSCGESVDRFGPDFDVDFHWTEAKYDELVAECPEAGSQSDDNPGPTCPACDGGRWIHEDGCVLEHVTWVTDGKQHVA